MHRILCTTSTKLLQNEIALHDEGASTVLFGLATIDKLGLPQKSNERFMAENGHL